MGTGNDGIRHRPRGDVEAFPPSPSHADPDSRRAEEGGATGGDGVCWFRPRLPLRPPLSKRTARFLLGTAAAALAGPAVRAGRYVAPRIERPLAGRPYLKAAAFNPLRTLRARWLDPRPGHVRTFALRNGTAFVINLDGDGQRLAAFAAANRGAYPGSIRRFSAHRWVVRAGHDYGDAIRENGEGDNPPPPARGDEERRLLRVQDEWSARLPFLRLAAREGKYGDAACLLSHVLLWHEHLLQGRGGTGSEDEARDEDDDDDEDAYLFVFEDDATLGPRLRETLTVAAPAAADLVFLAHPAEKRVAVPWGRPRGTTTEGGDRIPETATRVIGGFGSWGYVLTRRGARKLLDYLGGSRSPIDVSFFEAAALQVYLPVGTNLTGESGKQGEAAAAAAAVWPAVGHLNAGSTRRGHNE